MAAFKENTLSFKNPGGHTAGTTSNRNQQKSFSRIPLPVHSKKSHHMTPLRDTTKKLNVRKEESNESVIASKDSKKSSITMQEESDFKEEEFVPDPNSLRDILSDKPIAVENRESLRTSRYIPWIDDAPVSARSSIYRNKNTQALGMTPTSTNHRARINLLCERMVQSTAAMCQRMYSREKTTCLDELKMNLESEFSRMPPLTKSPSQPLLVNRRTDCTLVRSPSLPELSCTPLLLRNVHSNYPGSTTPLCTSRSRIFSDAAMKSRDLTRKLDSIFDNSYMHYEVDDELTSILTNALKPCGLNRTECQNPVAKVLATNNI